MPVRRLLAVGLWLCVTVSATAIVWAGTSTVAADLTDRPAPVVAHRDVVTALKSDPSAVETSPGITAPPTNRSTTTVDRGRSAPRAPVAPAPQPPGHQTPVPDVVTTIPAAAPVVPPAGDKPTPPTTQPPRPTATYSTPGGVVTVACNGYFFVELVSATPSNGYAVNVVTAGPYYVEVHFRRPGQDHPVWAFCLGQPLRAYDGPPARR